MDTHQRLTDDLTTAMKSRNTFATNTLRQAITAIRTEQKAGKAPRDLTDAQIQNVLAAEIKKRRETATIYTTAGATGRADLETREANYLESYLPAALDEDQMDQLITDAIATTAATTIKDMGKVMKVATANAATRGGRIDGKTLSTKVRTALTR